MTAGTIYARTTCTTRVLRRREVATPTHFWSYTHSLSSYAHTMAHKLSSATVIRYFSGEDTLPEVIFEGSDDELGMEDVSEDDSEPDFEPLEIIDQGE